MKITWFHGVVVVMLVTNEELAMVTNGRHKPLPAPALTGPVSLEEAIRRRRTAREFAEAPLAIEQVGQLCWAGQGITDRQGALRAAPSAGALYPIELYVVTAEGVSRYRPTDHSLEHHLAGDHRRPLQRAALGQEAIGHAPICIIIAAVVERTARKYHDRAERYCFMEDGHVAQNVLLQATALRLAGVPIGAFEDEQVAEALKLPKGHRVLYLLPLGHPRQ